MVLQMFIKIKKNTKQDSRVQKKPFTIECSGFCVKKLADPPQQY